MVETGSPDGNSKAGLLLPWGWLTLALATIAITSLGTLAVVAKKTNADTLSTVALALAVLAFAAQLIVSLAQGVAGAQQVAQVERVNTDTQSALAEIRATSSALLSTQEQHFGDVLKAALAKAVPEAVKDVATDESESMDVDAFLARVDELEDRILDNVGKILRSESGIAKAAPHRPLRRKASPDHERIMAYPEERRGRELMEILRSLSTPEAMLLTIRVNRAEGRTREGGKTGAWTSADERLSAAGQSLIDKGIFTSEIRKRQNGEPGRWIDLTDLGMELGSILIGPASSRPKWLVDAYESWHSTDGARD